MERRVAQLPEGSSPMRAADDLERSTPNRQMPPRRLSRRRSSSRQRDERGGSSIGTIGDFAQVRHHHQTSNHRAAGKLIPAPRLSSRAIWRCRCFDLSTCGGATSSTAATTTVKQYKKPNLEGLDLG